MTIGGRILTVLTEISTKLRLSNQEFIKGLTERESARFAAGAKGKAQVFQNASEGVDIIGTFKDFEYPILKDNVNLIFHDVFK